ncbi:MAG: cysteine--tRNA ligase [Pseudomonadota bacterium]|nr:cysteine--tRNA ligase [Pseudomonadota bacterium]
MLHIYNSLTRRKEPFVPIEPGRVRMYVCGMTVYDYCHIGHARVMVVFDAVVRYLRWHGYAVTYVRNITDVDDKIIRRAAENREDMAALTARFVQAMHEDAAALGVAPPDREPRATQAIAAIVALIRALLDKGFAYQGDSGDVYYDVSRFPPYGALANKNIDELRAGARVEVAEAKADPLDFVLWKAAKPGEPAWPAPWGAGRPGWHIECSAMAMSCLGERFDIHGGGMDLKFPHHENEIAQSEAVTGQRYVNYWMHNGFVQVDEEKMSKSLGNFFTVREVLQRYRPEVVRLFILSSHYRSPLNYSTENLETAKASLNRLYTALRGLPMQEPPPGQDHEARFRQAMDDDFNTPEALAVLFDLAHEVNRLREQVSDQAAGAAALLRRLGGLLGLVQADPEAFLQEAETQSGGLSRQAIEQLIQQRAAARQARQWAEADRIRAQLAQAGIVLEDGPGETVWRRG